MKRNRLAMIDVIIVVGLVMLITSLFTFVCNYWIATIAGVSIFYLISYIIDKISPDEDKHKKRDIYFYINVISIPVFSCFMTAVFAITYDWIFGTVIGTSMFVAMSITYNATKNDYEYDQ